MITREELVHIGKVTKSHGLDGEVEISANSDLIEECELPYIVAEIDGIFVPFFISEYRYKNNTSFLFQLKGIETENEAKELIKCEVFIHKDFLADGMSAADMEGGNFFIGFSIYTENGKFIGVINDIDDSTENVLFQLFDEENNEIIIPATDDFVVEIDEVNKKIIMNLPEGLLSI